MDFKDRIILITGASRGIGKRLSLDLGARGAVVIGCGRTAENLEAAAVELRSASPRSTMIRCDVGSRQEVHAMMQQVLAEFGVPDILINNAGIGMRKPFVEISLDTMEDLMRINYLGAVYCTHEVLPSMIARGRGHIVNISSVAGHIGTLNMAGYCASKFALNGFTESLYYELKPLGIDISLICPGPVRTGFNRTFADTKPKAPESMIISAESVSATVIRAIEQRRFEVINPRSMALMCRFNRLMPSLFRAITRRVLRPHVSTPKKIVT